MFFFLWCLVLVTIHKKEVLKCEKNLSINIANNIYSLNEETKFVNKKTSISSGENVYNFYSQLV